MTHNQITLAEELIDIAVEVAGDRGCTDMHPLFFARWTDEEKIGTTREYLVYDGDIKRLAEFQAAGVHRKMSMFSAIPNYEWLAFLAHKLIVIARLSSDLPKQMEMEQRLNSDLVQRNNELLDRCRAAEAKLREYESPSRHREDRLQWLEGFYRGVLEATEARLPPAVHDQAP